METSITLGTILEHLRAFESRMLSQLSSLEQRLGGRIDSLEGHLNALERRIDRMERNLTRQIDAIDKRLDAVEIEQLPQRMTRIEQHLHLSPVA